MPLDGLSLHALRQELTERLSNARVLKIFQPWSDALILHLRVGNTVERLLLSASPQLPAAHITQLQPDNPVQAPVFCMVLRKHLEPARLLRIEQVGLDRILHFVFETFEERGQRVERVLAVELTGRRSNIVLLDPNAERVIDALRRGGSASSGRHTAPGALYEPPVIGAGEKVNPFTESSEAFLRYMRLSAAPKSLHRLIMERYDGFGPFAAQEIVLHAGFPIDTTRGDVSIDDLEQIARAFFDLMSKAASGQFEPTLFHSDSGPDSWLFTPVAPRYSSHEQKDSMSKVADTVFAKQHHSLRVERVQNELLRGLRRALTRAENKLGERQKEETAAGEAELYRHYGDLLTAHLHEMKPHAESITVADYTDDYAEVTIPLSLRLSPVQNVQAYYRKYNRAKRALAELKGLIRAAKVERDYLSQVISTIELAESENDLEEIRQELIQQRLLPKPASPHRSRQKAPRASRPIRYNSSDGHPIWVGRNNRQNDQLTLRTAQPDDVWFHAKDIPGSHVILRTNMDPTQAAIEDAAMIAAYYSQARESANVPVDYVVRKHVRKPAGAPPGYVIYDHHKTVFVTPTPELVERLKVEERNTEDQ